MNIDETGLRIGLDSEHYRNTFHHSDTYLSEYILKWINAGYQIIVTADHGMNDDRTHGGTLAEERKVPLYVIGSCFSHDQEDIPKQLDFFGSVSVLLGLSDHKKPITNHLLHEQFNLMNSKLSLGLHNQTNLMSNASLLDGVNQ